MNWDLRSVHFIICCAVVGQWENAIWRGSLHCHSLGTPIWRAKSVHGHDCRFPLKGNRRLSHAAMRDLQWWDRLSTNEHIERSPWPTTDAKVFKEARMSDWGEAWNSLVPVTGFFRGEARRCAHQPARGFGRSIRSETLLPPSSPPILPIHYGIEGKESRPHMMSR